MKSIALIITMLSAAFVNAQTLEDYQTMAVESNPGLMGLYKEYEASMQKVAQVSTLPDPSFSFGYFISPVETRLGAQRVRLSLTQMFPWFGTLKAQGDAAALMAEAKFQSFADARNKLFFQVAAAYYPLYELHELTSLEKENIRILEAYKAIATSKFENGNGGMVDVIRVDIMLSEAQTNLSIMHDKEKPLRLVFNKLLNRPDEEKVLIADSLNVEDIEVDYRKDSLLINNPLLNALELKLKASEWNAQIAQKRGLPKIGVGLDYVVIGKRTDVIMPDNGKDALMPMLTLSLPVFRGKYRASVKEAQLAQESYAYAKSETANNLISGYEMAWFEINQQQKLASLYDNLIQSSQQSLNLLFTAYGNSGKDFEEVLRMQQQLLKYSKMRSTALAQQQIALAKINYLTAKTN